MRSVQVLMSTYNGHKYLNQQIESILEQEGVLVNLLIRDDGSEDDTLDIINKYNVKLILGENVKPAKSFMELLDICDTSSDYYAFADQDDYWQKNKLYEAIQKIGRKELEYPNKPILYFSSKNIVDSNLKFKYKQNAEQNIRLGSAMIKNIATGCTMVFNKKMLEVLKQYKPENVEMHDAWVYRLCLAINGIVINDKNSYIQYRQHGNNVIGAKENFANMINRRIRSFREPKFYRSNMAKELIKGYKQLISKENLEILSSFSNYKKDLREKMKLMFNKNIKLKGIKDNLIFKLAVLFNLV